MVLKRVKRVVLWALKRIGIFHLALASNWRKQLEVESLLTGAGSLLPQRSSSTWLGKQLFWPAAAASKGRGLLPVGGPSIPETRGLSLPANCKLQDGKGA